MATLTLAVSVWMTVILTDDFLANKTEFKKKEEKKETYRADTVVESNNFLSAYLFEVPVVPWL